MLLRDQYLPYMYSFFFFKTIKIEIGLCSIRPDITLLIIYVPTISYPKIVKRLLAINVPKLKTNCFLSYPTEPKCCNTLCTKAIMERKTTCTSIVYLYTTRIMFNIKLYRNVFKLFYIIKCVGLYENIFFL